MNQVANLSAWRWLLILEGLPSIVSAVLVYLILPDYPETAKWLSAEEKALAAERLKVEGSHGFTGHMTWQDAKETLTDWRLYGHYAVQVLVYSCGKMSTDRCAGLLWNLGPFLITLALHANHYHRTWIQWTTCSAHGKSPSLASTTRSSLIDFIADSPTIRGCICRDFSCGLVGRPLQQAWSSQCNLCYNRCFGVSCVGGLATRCLQSSLRLPNCCRFWSFCVYSPSPRLAE